MALRVNFAGIEKSLAVMAHFTTAIAFGTAIVGLVFPEQAADYVSTLLSEIETTRESLQNVETNTATTASVAAALSDRMADRPRFAAESHLVQTATVQGKTANVHQFQMTLENLTDKPITDLVVVIGTKENGFSSSFLGFVVPPFETHREATTGIANLVCYSYAWNGGYVTETRTVEMNPTPMLDQMGNAGTYLFNHLGYDFQESADAESFNCNGQTFSRSELAARKAQLDSSKSP